MGSRHQETTSLAASNYIIFHFSQKTSIKLKIHKKSVSTFLDKYRLLMDNPELAAKYDFDKNSEADVNGWAKLVAEKSLKERQ